MLLHFLLGNIIRGWNGETLMNQCHSVQMPEEPPPFMVVAGGRMV